MRRRWATAVAVAVVLAAIVAGLAWSAPREEQVAPRASSALRIPVGPEKDGSAVTLDVDLYLPDAAEPAPAVVLAHGFGGDKGDLRSEASRLAARGYVVLAYTARGFGTSGGSIHLMDPDYEVADATVLIDRLAAEPRVRRDGDGDPVVALAGASYGGALALMAAAADQRVDAVAALMTWNDLAQAFFPQAAQRGGVDAVGPLRPIATPGPYKQLWGANFLLGAIAGSGGRTANQNGSGSGQCGRFEPDLCRLFIRAAETGRPDPALLDLLRRHSPAPTLERVRAPVYLVQGMGDSLFGIDQADASARALLAAGTPLTVRWTNGGHDSGGAGLTLAGGSDAAARTERAQIDASLDDFLGAALGRGAESPTPATESGFTYAVRARRGQDAATTYTLPSYATVLAPSDRRGVTRLALRERDPLTVLNPPGGVPAAITSVPGGFAAVASTYQLAALPGQSAAFDSTPIREAAIAAGAPRLQLQVTSSGKQVTLFATVWQVQGGTARLLRPLTAAARVPVTPGETTNVDLALPSGTWELSPGSSWRVLLSATDQAYRGEDATRVDRIQLAEPVLLVPTVRGDLGAGPAAVDPETLWVLAMTALTLVIVAGSRLVSQMRTRRHPVAAQDDPDAVLVIDGLSKVYADGHRAVDDVSWSARRGQVVGLLGPNGAGKTTTLRMAVGLIRPDAGETRIRGGRVTPGAPVLGEVGTLIEGPGFVPHLTGRQNLHAYWAATGRPAEEAHMTAALDVAALGGALDRPVKSYSHGMKQRLGIAQAMLGLPDLLILDEPTNGLDPPQIAALRPILRSYAASGRTVVISSHLLAEVQMTCSHVVVMHAGRVLAAGAVGDLGVTNGRTLEDVFLETIAGVGAGGRSNGAGPDGDGHDPDGPAAGVDALTERLRQVRAR